MPKQDARDQDEPDGDAEQNLSPSDPFFAEQPEKQIYGIGKHDQYRGHDAWRVSFQIKGLSEMRKHMQKNKVLNAKNMKKRPFSAAMYVKGIKMMNSMRTATANWLLVNRDIFSNAGLTRSGRAGATRRACLFIHGSTQMISSKS